MGGTSGIWTPRSAGLARPHSGTSRLHLCCNRGQQCHHWKLEATFACIFAVFGGTEVPAQSLVQARACCPVVMLWFLWPSVGSRGLLKHSMLGPCCEVPHSFNEASQSCRGTLVESIHVGYAGTMSTGKFLSFSQDFLHPRAVHGDGLEQRTGLESLWFAYPDRGSSAFCKPSIGKLLLRSVEGELLPVCQCYVWLWDSCSLDHQRDKCECCCLEEV